MARKPGSPKYTKQDLIRERWLRGNLNYKLHAGQRLIRKRFDESSANQLFVGECSRQFGKTVFEAVLALEKAFSKKKAKVKIGTAFQTDLLEFIIPAFDLVMEDCPEDLKPVWKSQKSKYILPHNGSEIKLVGLDRKPNGLRGTVIDLIILSEAGFIANLHYLFKSVIIPATTHRPDCRVTMLSTPPETPAHEFLDYVQKAEMEGGHIKLTIYDNPMLDEVTIARLMKEAGGPESTTWQREYLCMHVTDANLQIVAEWKDEFWTEVERGPEFKYYHKYSAMDLGVRDFTAHLFGYYHFKKAALVIEDEFMINGPTMTTLVLQQMIKEKEKEIWGLDEFGVPNKIHRRISDNNNPLLIQDLSSLHQLHYSETDKGRLEAMVNTVKIMVRQGSILVHPRCKFTRGCLKYGIWDKHRDQFSRSEVYGHYDALAALIYLVRNLDKTTNPIPIDFQVDKMNQLVFPDRRQTSSAQAFKQAFALKQIK